MKHYFLNYSCVFFYHLENYVAIVGKLHFFKALYVAVQ